MGVMARAALRPAGSARRSCCALRSLLERAPRNLSYRHVGEPALNAVDRGAAPLPWRRNGKAVSSGRKVRGSDHPAQRSHGWRSPVAIPPQPSAFRRTHAYAHVPRGAAWRKNSLQMPVTAQTGQEEMGFGVKKSVWRVLVTAPPLGLAPAVWPSGRGAARTVPANSFIPSAIHTGQGVAIGWRIQGQFMKALPR
jgi:hypothetical protein